MTETVAAVVVTYNRKQLLAECLDALLAQTKPVDKIILIDNASTDGTPQLLEERGYLANPVMDYVRLRENTGGAGGFYEGVKRAYQAGYDFFWLMDDDTRPMQDSLLQLYSSFSVLDEKVGYVCSRVEWVDGKPHFMNIPSVSAIVNGVPFNYYEKRNLYIINSCSFVSVLIAKEAVGKSGFPLKEMYIWADDVEYTMRISKNGFIGIYNQLSRVVHNTRDNYNVNILSDSACNMWKYKFGIRNSLFISRKYRGFVFYLAKMIYGLTIFNFKLLISMRTNKARAIIINTRSHFSSFAFNPSPEFPDE